MRTEQPQPQPRPVPPDGRKANDKVKKWLTKAGVLPACDGKLHPHPICSDKMPEPIAV